MIYFDYIYYRLTKAYFKWDGRKGITSIIGVSMLQSMLIGDFVALILGFLYTKEQTAPYSKSLAISWAVVFVGFIFFNFYRYKNRYNEFKKRWSNESKTQTILNGILVVIALLLPWVIIISASIMRG